MDVLTIYNPDGSKLLDAYLDSSTQDWAIMSENRVQMEFYSEECILLPSGCYVDFDDRRFWLLDEYKPTLESSLEYAYNVKFVGAESLLSGVLMLKTTDGEDNPIFPLTAPAAQHLALIVANLRRRFPDIPWHVGDVVETENIYIEYAGTYCADAIQQIVSGRDAEWWVDDEYGINVGRCELGDLVELGYQKGLIGGITHSLANNLRSYAYLCPIGSTRNIDPEKYGHDRLQLPNGIKLIPMNPEQGVAELAEANAFAGIYPRYIGEVTAVRTEEGTNEDGSKFTIYFIEDAAIPFNPNEYELPGKVKNIAFQSGELMGADFEVNYDEIAHEFEIITQWPNGGAQLPGGFLVPAVGDKYVVWNISMPDEYYPLAEEEFLTAARKFAQDSVKDASVYRAPVDYVDVQERGLTLRPGQRVRLLSAEYFPSTGYYDSRITRIVRDIRYPNEITVEISTVRAEGTIARLQSAIQQTETQLKQVEQSVGEMPAIITSTSVVQPTDSNVYSALRSNKEFLSKEKGGTVKKKVNFVESIQLFGRDFFRYDEVNDALELNCNLVVTGGSAFFTKLEGFEKKTITQAINCDGATIHINDAGQLEVIGGAGGFDEEELAEYLLTNEYIRKQDLDKRFSKTEIQKALGIYDWALASTKPKYKYSEIQNAPLRYDAETGAWELNSDLTVKRSSAMIAAHNTKDFIGLHNDVRCGLWYNQGTTTNGTKWLLAFNEERSAGWFPVPMAIGTSGAQPNYMLYVNGSSLFAGSITTNKKVTTNDPGYNIGSASYMFGRTYTNYVDTQSGWNLRLCSAGTEVITITTAGNVRIGAPSGTSRATFDVTGDAFISGQLAHALTSDRRLKRNIRKFSAAKYLRSLGGVFEFEYIDEEVARDKYYKGTHLGFIYQNVKGSRLTGMCIERENGFGALNLLHSDYLALLGAAAIEHEDRIHTLERQIKTLQKELKQLKSA